MWTNIFIFNLCLEVSFNGIQEQVSTSGVILARCCFMLSVEYVALYHRHGSRLGTFCTTSNIFFGFYVVFLKVGFLCCDPGWIWKTLKVVYCFYVCFWRYGMQICFNFLTYVSLTFLTVHERSAIDM